jgi:hypothetical protein
LETIHGVVLLRLMESNRENYHRPWKDRDQWIPRDVQCRSEKSAIGTVQSLISSTFEPASLPHRFVPFWKTKSV